MELTDIVVGVPFCNESETITEVIATARKGLAEFYPDQKSLIVAVGSPAGSQALKAIETACCGDRTDCLAFLLNGKGWSISSIVELTDFLGADLILLEADLKSRPYNGDIQGLSPEWIRLLIDPFRSGEMDMVISRFNRHYFQLPVSTLTYSLFTAIYNCPIRRLTGGQWGTAHHLIGNLRRSTFHAWNVQLSGYGVDAWLATAAVMHDARICQANPGVKNSPALYSQSRSGLKAGGDGSVRSNRARSALVGRVTALVTAASQEIVAPVRSAKATPSMKETKITGTMV